MKVAVIGAGPAGLCCGRHLIADPKVFEFDIFERQNDVGGTWRYSDKVGLDEFGLPIHSSMYKSLRLHVPKEVMAFPDFPFPDCNRKSFLHHSEMFQYLKDYSQHFNLYKHIKFHTLVENVKPLNNVDNRVKWYITYSDLVTKERKTKTYDAVMVCNGRYTVPCVPDIPGLNDFQGIVMHSHDYRDPTIFKNLKVVILGAGASGIDIGAEISSLANEVDIAKLIAKSQEKDKKIQASSIEPCSQPSPRSGFSFCSHPDKEELILFGGEYFNGTETTMYNELYLYNIKKEAWCILKSPVAPPPRCSHQAIVVSQNGGQMWIFGGEFASPTKCSFYHYRDLWVLHLATMTWEQVKAPGGPSARSGHRMVVSRKQIVLFGGFYEIIGDYKYFNDVHIFNLESYTWTKVEPTGKVPCPRSGCLMAPLMDGRILIYGGYSRDRVKKDVDKGTSYTDMYYLQADEKTGTLKWKWVQAKSSGIPPSPRSGLSMAVAANNFAYAFGGVHDEADEEELLSGVFQNDLYQLELDKGRWMPITLQGKGSKVEKKRRRKAKGDAKEEESDDEDIAEELEKTAISETAATTYDDSIFTVKIGPSASQSTSGDLGACSSGKAASAEVFAPKARMNSGMVIKNGILYLYGGMYEEGDKQLTLSDFHSLNIHKVDEWRTLIPFVTEAVEWIDSEESESDEDDADMDEEDDDSDDEDDEMDMS